MLENTNTKQFYPGPILNRTLEITKFLFRNPEQVKLQKTALDEYGKAYDIELTYGTDYEVQKVLPNDINIEDTNLTASTGQITLKSTVEVKEGEKLTAYRESALVQDTDYPRTGKFPAASHEGALDYLTMQNQEQQDQIDRSLKIPVSIQNFNAQMPIPLPAKALKINATGDGFEMSEYDPDLALDATKEYAQNAQNAANAALASQSAAASSSQSAIEQATIAKEQTNIATTQAGIATAKTSEVIESGNIALANIDTAKTGALSNITTAKNNAITSITTQETTSKNNVITTGNEQVERVNLTGVDNRTPIFSKNEIGTNEGVYNKVYDMKHSTFDLSKLTVIGSPTITDDGVASGFSSSNYLSTSYVPNQNYKTFSIKFKFNTGSTKTGIYIIGDKQYTINFLLAWSSKNTLVLWLSTDNNRDIANGIFGKTILQFNKDYWINLTFDGTKYVLYISTDGKTYTPEITVTSSLKANIWQLYMGCVWGASTNYIYDLSHFSITVDGKEVFNGNKTGIDTVKINGTNIEIPYTLSKTGSKIVDVTYRDRVIDLYEQEGQAGYYTIDEENKNFTLPMGEIYGMIEQKADKVNVEEQLANKADVSTPSIQAPYLKTSYVNGTSGYRIWSDKYCEQWGRINAKSTLTFLKAFANTNYSIRITPIANTGADYRNPQATDLTTTTCYISMGNSNYTYLMSWRACGYIA